MTTKRHVASKQKPVADFRFRAKRMSVRPSLMFEIGTTVLLKSITCSTLGRGGAGKVSNAASCASPSGHRQQHRIKIEITTRMTRDLTED